MPLFDNVLYHISQSLSETTRAEISRILDYNGGVGTSLKNATHVISNTIEFEGCDTLGKSVFCVTPYWVERSMELGSLQDVQYFSADKGQFFSGVVVACADLPKGDGEVICSGIEERGGSYRDALTRDVTHLVVSNVNSEKYKVAMHFRESARITVVLPHWFDQCWAMQMCIPTTLFQFPDPLFLKHQDDPNWYKAQLSKPDSTDYLKDCPNKKALFHTLNRELSFRERSPRDIWQGRGILLSASLELNDDRRKALKDRIRSAGGLVIPGAPDDEGTIVDSADILITQYRSGSAYNRALDKGKTIGTLAWFLYVDKTGILSRPRDQLLHYPVRPEPIPGFEHHEITVTNYQGNARDYLKKLIQLMGATFTPTMSGKNTIVIAAYKSGTKTDKAQEWSVPIVHHKWLEDCFVEWRNLTPALKKYVDFTPGFNYGSLLGERGVGHVGLAQADKGKEDDQDQDLVKASDTPASPTKSPKRPQPATGVTKLAAASGNSFLEAEEVEEALSVTEPLPKGPIKIGPPRGVRSPLKKQSTTKPLLVSNTTQRPSKVSKPKANKVDPDLGQQKATVEKLKKETTKAALPKLNYTPKPLTNVEGVGSDESARGVRLKLNKFNEPARKNTVKDSADEEANDEELSEVFHPFSPPKPSPGSKSKSPVKQRLLSKHPSSSAVLPSDSDSDVVEVRSPEIVKSPAKGKMKEQSKVDDAPAKPKSKTSAKPTFTKRPPPASTARSSDSDVVETKRPKVSKTYKSPTKAKAKQTRDASSSSDEGDQPESIERTEKVASRPKAIARKAMSLTSGRILSVEPPASNRLAPKPIVKKKPPAKSSAISEDDDSDHPNPLSDHTVSIIKDTLTSRRQAAAAATQRLRTQIMPDVINYENERKKSAATTRRRKSSLGTALHTNVVDEKEDSETNTRIVKKARTSTAAEDFGNGANRLVTHVKNAAKTVADEGEAGDHKKKARGLSKLNGATVNQLNGSSSTDPKKIRIMTTKIGVPEDVEQALTKLGVRFTTKPSDCTHLIASRMARTEKFLCALPQAPYVLNKDWLLACAKEKKIVAEESFALQDPDAEQKHKFKLSEALQRAKELKKKKVKLLQGHTFYITPNLKVDYDMFVNVLKANGADVKRTMPNARNLSNSSHVHIISCLKDEHLWSTQHKIDMPIYSQELVFSAAFKQLVDWDSAEMRIEVEVD